MRYAKGCSGNGEANVNVTIIRDKDFDNKQVDSPSLHRSQVVCWAAHDAKKKKRVYIPYPLYRRMSRDWCSAFNTPSFFHGTRPPPDTKTATITPAPFADSYTCTNIPVEKGSRKRNNKKWGS